MKLKRNENLKVYRKSIIHQCANENVSYFILIEKYIAMLY